jgi:hypothetical protein
MPTTPGFHPDFSFPLYPGELHAAIRRVASSFYVTRAFKPVQLGNSTYHAILVRPTDEFSVYINTDREIVVLFSTYGTFEVRTLDAYDDIYSLLESNRSDRSVRFLISNDSNIERAIRHFLDQHPEYPIIIPATFQQLLDPPANALVGAVRRNYLLRDLFGYQNPLREETFFFGRQQVVAAVLDMAKSGQSSSLFGLRKSGKTSTIYAIQRKAKSFACNVAVIDCQRPAVHSRRYDGLLCYVLGEVRKAIGYQRPILSLGNNLVEVSENFVQQMNSVLALAKSNVVLIFDEIENISPNTAASEHWRKDNDTIYFWQIIRSYVQSEGGGRLSICIVGTSPHILELSKINNIDNPIYLYAQKKFIPSLSFDDTCNMVKRLGYFMGLEFSEGIISDLHKEFGGHPFFTRQVCSRIHQNAPSERPVAVSQQALERAKVEFHGQLESYLRDIVESLRDCYPEEFALLRAVTLGDKTEITEYGNEAPDLIDHLIGYNMIEKVGNDFDIRFAAIKTVLQRIITLEEGEDRWAEISRRRNVLESQIRITLYHWSRSLSPEQWTALINDSLTEIRLEKLPSHEPAVLFSSKTSPLYLTDLLALLKRAEVLPYLADRRGRLIKHLNTVNKLRKDAHANRVADAEMVEVRAAFDALEAEFLPP